MLVENDKMWSSFYWISFNLTETYRYYFLVLLFVLQSLQFIFHDLQRTLHVLQFTFHDLKYKIYGTIYKS